MNRGRVVPRRAPGPSVLAKPPATPQRGGTGERSPGALDVVLCVVGLVLVSDAVLWAALGTTSRSAALSAGTAISGDFGFQVSFAALYAASAARLLATRGLVAARLLDPWAGALIVLAVASTVWSVEPDLSLRRGIALLGTTTFGLYLGVCFGEIALARLLHRTAIALAVASFVAVVALPDIGIMPTYLDATMQAMVDGDGPWRGVFSHKNGLGGTMALGLIAGIFVLRARPPRSPLVLMAEIAGMAMMAAALLFSGSATALVLTGAGCTIAWLMTLRGPDPAALGLLAFAAALATAAAGALALANIEAVAMLLGRDATLTGRTPLWAFSIDMIGREPILGYGFTAFWSGPDAPGARYWFLTDSFEIHSHNGLIQLALDLGLVGAMLFLACFAGYVVRAFGLAARGGRLDEGLRGRWHLLFAAVFALSNLSESALLVPHGSTWTLLVANLAGMHIGRPAAVSAKPAPRAWRGAPRWS